MQYHTCNQNIFKTRLVGSDLIVLKSLQLFFPAPFCRGVVTIAVTKYQLGVELSKCHEGSMKWHVTKV